MIKPGDEIRTKCVFKSTSKSRTTFKGDATSDEMCYGFLTVHPITNVRRDLCTSWRNISELQLYFSPDKKDCDYKVFHNPYHPNMSKLYENVATRCLPLSHCLEECKEAVKEFRRHPCMQGEMAQLTKSHITAYLKSLESYEFYSKLESCDLEILREELEGEGGERGTSGGAHIVPQFLALFSMFILLM
jgi:dopamine beta-monooxygenase